MQITTLPDQRGQVFLFDCYCKIQLKSVCLSIIKKSIHFRDEEIPLESLEGQFQREFK